MEIDFLQRPEIFWHRPQIEGRERTLLVFVCSSRLQNRSRNANGTKANGDKRNSHGSFTQTSESTYLPKSSLSHCCESKHRQRHRPEATLNDVMFHAKLPFQEKSSRAAQGLCRSLKPRDFHKRRIATQSSPSALKMDRKTVRIDVFP